MPLQDDTKDTPQEGSKPQEPAAPSASEISAKERLIKAASASSVAPAPPPAGIVFETKDAPGSVPRESGTPLVKASGFEKIERLGDSPLRPLRTFREDIEDTVKRTQASVVSIAAKEAGRRAAQGAAIAETAATDKGRGLRMTLIGASVFLVLLGIGALLAVLLQGEGERPQAFSPTAPVFVDEATELPLGDLSRRTLLETLTELRAGTALSLGLVRQIYPTETATTGAKTLVAPAAFLGRMAEHAPEALLRTLKEPYLLGIHVFDGNQPFFLFTTSSYEQAFAGMLSWEPSMAGDLAPLFARNPRPRTFRDATTTPPTSVIGSVFRDRIVENKDARVLQNEYGDILLLWSFIDRDTLLIATNEGTLREVISRIKNAPLDERPDN